MTPIPGPPPLGKDEVHVWQIDLDKLDTRGLFAVLGADEVERAERFHFELDRTRFVVARAALRHILAGYLQASAADVAFDYGAHGKPSLAAPWPDLSFNLSHSHGLGLCAVTRGRRIGIDVERIRVIDDLDRLAERLFSRRERAALRRLSGNDRLNGFFSAWTRKEAFIKALGEGLSHPLDRFDVSLAPTAPPRLERIDGDPVQAAQWSLSALNVSAEHVAAVVVEGPLARLVERFWPSNLVKRCGELR